MGNTRWWFGHSGGKKQYRRVKYHYRKRYYHNSADIALSVWDKARRLEVKAFNYMLKKTRNHKRSADYARAVKNRYLDYMEERRDYSSRHITSKFRRKMNYSKGRPLKRDGSYHWTHYTKKGRSGWYRKYKRSW